MEEVKKAPRGEDIFHMWWLGQSGVLVSWNGKHLLLDPYLSESLTKKYADTDKPHVRMTERVVGPERLDFVDVVTSSHNHTDHLDGETLPPLIEANPKMAFIIPEANRDFVAARVKCDRGFPLGCDDGVTVEAGGFSFTGVPSAHEELDKDDQGRYPYLGYVVKFGKWSFYHSGDCCDWPGLADRLRALGPIDIAWLPINGRNPARRVPGNMSGAEAADLAKRAGARLVIPHHYQMFEFNTASPDDFEEACRQKGQAYRILRNGEGISSGDLPG